MAFFKARVGDRTFELPKLTLGEARILKRDFGLDDLEFFSLTDPDQLVGLLYLCLRRERPDASHEDLIAEIEALDIEEFDDRTDAPDPTQPPPAASKRGSRATPRKQPGTPS